MRRCGWMLVAGLGLGSVVCEAQERPVLQKAPEQPATIRADARLVAIPVVVRDKKGVLLQALTKADFVLTVDGQPQTIRYFDKDTDLPLTLGLLVDTSLSQRKVLDEEKQASTTFLDTMLTANSSRKDAGGDKADRAFVIQFAHSTELLQDVTDSRPKLQAGLKAIDVSSDGGRQDPQPDDSGGGGSGRLGGGHGGYGHGGGGTTLYDAVFLSSDEIMSKQHGRKALIILSDGDDRGSKESLTRAIEAAQRADAVIYAIYFKGESGGGFGGFPGGGGGHGGGGRGGGGGYPGGGGGGRGGGGGDQVDGKKVLARMADETGGRLFEVKGKQTVAAIYTEIGDELRTQYRLGYSPTADGAAEGYHRLEVSVPSQKSVQVQTRDGYYTGTR